METQQIQNGNTVAQAVESSKPVTYKSAGQDVTLSRTIVRNYLTKGESKVTDADIVQFISICQFNQLNPFLNEAYLIKYGNQPAQMVVSKEALLKRADACGNYEGMQAGVIVLRNGQVEEVEGCFLAPEDKLIGGWAKVYRSDRKFPYVSKVSLSEYNKGQSLWKEKPSTMISKIAKVQALREAFPAQLGAMYTMEEQGDVEEQNPVEVEIRNNANAQPIGLNIEESGEPSKPLAASVDMATGEMKNEPQNLNPGF